MILRHNINKQKTNYGREATYQTIQDTKVNKAQ